MRTIGVIGAFSGAIVGAGAGVKGGVGTRLVAQMLGGAVGGFISGYASTGDWQVGLMGAIGGAAGGAMAVGSMEAMKPLANYFAIRKYERLVRKAAAEEYYRRKYSSEKGWGAATACRECDEYWENLPSKLKKIISFDKILDLTSAGSMGLSGSELTLELNQSIGVSSKTVNVGLKSLQFVGRGVGIAGTAYSAYKFSSSPTIGNAIDLGVNITGMFLGPGASLFVGGATLSPQYQNFIKSYNQKIW